MVKVKNRSTLRLLTTRFMELNRGRNLIAVLAIALTALLFSSLFTGTASMILTKIKANRKASYCWSDAVVQDLTREECERAVSALEAAGAVSRYGVGLFLGTAEDARFPFLLEVRTGDENTAEGWGCFLEEGSLPAAEKEIAVSTVVLDTLGVSRKIGEEITLSIQLGPGRERTDTFLLSGYWEGDQTDTHQMAWVSSAYGERNAAPLLEQDREEGIVNSGYSCSLWLDSLWNADRKLKALNEAAGLTGPVFRISPAYDFLAGEDGFSYGMVLALILVVLLAGCLIIYNIFNISVRTDLRTYGLLKNVGTTGRQLKRIVRMQAMRLSLAGIPLGLALGWGCGIFLAPAINQDLQGNTKEPAVISANPAIFAAAGALALFTVYLSCMQACHMVERVSPVEALRMAENEETGRRRKKNFSVSWWGMAVQNMGRGWKRGLIVMFSIALSLVTLNGIVILATGFDFDQYAAIILSSDFELGKITSSLEFADFNGITLKTRQALERCPYEAEIGYVSYSRQEIRMEQGLYQAWAQVMDQYYDSLGDAKEVWDEAERTGRIKVQYFGLNEAAFRKLEWLEGEGSWEEFQRGGYVVVTDYPTRFSAGEFYYHTGDSFEMEYGDGEKEEYTVLGSAVMPYSLTYPYYDPVSLQVFVPESEFLARTNNEAAMYATLDVEEGQEKDVQKYLEDAILSQDSTLNLTSIVDLRQTFGQYLNRYYMIGGCLTVVLAFIGIMNFYNTTATSILSRKRELALQEAVGMTKRQLRNMLVAEGCLYLGGALLLAVPLTLFCSEKLLRTLAGSAFFFRFQPTVLPSLLMLPVLLLLSWAVPCRQFAGMSRESVVERIRQN